MTTPRPAGVHKEGGVFGRGELDREFGAVWAVSRLAGAADLADDRTHSDVWGVDEIAEGFVADGGVSFFRKYVAGVRHLGKALLRTLGCRVNRKLKNRWPDFQIGEKSPLHSLTAL